MFCIQSMYETGLWSKAALLMPPPVWHVPRVRPRKVLWSLRAWLSGTVLTPPKWKLLFWSCVGRNQMQLLSPNTPQEVELGDSSVMLAVGIPSGELVGSWVGRLAEPSAVSLMHSDVHQ